MFRPLPFVGLVSLDYVGLDYVGSEQRKHHAIYWFFGTTIDRVSAYHYRGNLELPGTNAVSAWI
jgi:hypothetical protein